MPEYSEAHYEDAFRAKVLRRMNEYASGGPLGVTDQEREVIARVMFAVPEPDTSAANEELPLPVGVRLNADRGHYEEEVCLGCGKATRIRDCGCPAGTGWRKWTPPEQPPTPAAAMNSASERAENAIIELRQAIERANRRVELIRGQWRESSDAGRAVIAKRDARIAELEHLASDRDEAMRKASITIHEQGERIATLESRLAEVNARVTDFAARLVTVKREAHALLHLDLPADGASFVRPHAYKIIATCMEQGGEREAEYISPVSHVCKPPLGSPTREEAIGALNRIRNYIFVERDPEHLPLGARLLPEILATVRGVLPEIYEVRDAPTLIDDVAALRAKLARAVEGLKQIRDMQGGCKCVPGTYDCILHIALYALGDEWGAP